MPNETKKTYAAQMEASRCDELMMRTRELPGECIADKIEFAIRAGERELSIRMPNGDVLAAADEAYNNLRNIIAGALSAADVAKEHALHDRDMCIKRLQDANLSLQAEITNYRQKIDQAGEQAAELQAEIKRLSVKTKLQEETNNALREQIALMKQQLANTVLMEEFVNSVNQRWADRENGENNHNNK